MREGGQTQVKHGIAWRIGSERDIQWVRDGTGVGRQIMAAIPPVFAEDATLVRPGDPDVPRDVRHERHQGLALVELLRRHTRRSRWWLGYLDTGASTELPALMFPEGHAWLVSTLWDDDWSCTAAPRHSSRISCRIAFSAGTRARVSVGEDAVPPGHAAQ